MLQVLQFIVSLAKLSETKLDSHFRMLEKVGVWHVEDMCVFDIMTIKHCKDSKYRNRISLWTSLPDYFALPSNMKKEIRGIKIFADGALAAHSAALVKKCTAGDKSMLLYSNDEMLEVLRIASNTDKPVAIHVIGDAALEQVLLVLRKIGLPKKNLCVRLEHCQFISKEVAQGLKSYGVVLSMQPNFSYDSTKYADTLPSAYCKKNNPFRMLIDDVKYKAGENLIFGSDGMPHGMEHALKWSLFPLYETQKLTIDEFVNGYCMPNTENGYVEVEVDEKTRDVEMVGLYLSSK